MLRRFDRYRQSKRSTPVGNFRRIPRAVRAAGPGGLACETARYQDGVVQKQIKLFSYGSSDFSQLGKTTVLRGLSDLSAELCGRFGWNGLPP